MSLCSNVRHFILLSQIHWCLRSSAVFPFLFFFSLLYFFIYSKSLFVLVKVNKKRHKTQDITWTLVDSFTRLEINSGDNQFGLFNRTLSFSWYVCSGTEDVYGQPIRRDDALLTNSSRLSEYSTFVQIVHLRSIIVRFDPRQIQNPDIILALSNGLRY